MAPQHGPANGTVGGHLAAIGTDGRNARQRLWIVRCSPWLIGIGTAGLKVDIIAG